MAMKMEKFFEKEVAKMKKAEAEMLLGTSVGGMASKNVRPPSLEEKEKFCKSLFQLNASDVGSIIAIVDHYCPAVLNKVRKSYCIYVCIYCPAMNIVSSHN